MIEKKPTVLYVMYSHKKIAENYDCRIQTKVHGIFTETEISKYAELRKKVGASCMIVPLNKFVENGVDL